MAWIQNRWSLKVTDPDEGDPGETAAKDEPSLQFAFITHFGSEVRVHGYTTGNLFPTNHGVGAGDPRRPDKVGIVSSKNVPTTRNPFFGLVVRAVEQDRSLDRDREDDNQRFYDAVGQLTQTVFDSGGVPLAEQLMFAGESVELNDRIFRNDDDRIGVGAMVFPNYGSETIPLIPEDESSLSAGARIPGTIRTFGFTFRTSAARYLVGCNIRLVTNDPDAPRLIGETTIEP
ncbi:hypothetical protein [Yoonia maritima]|uniref:hypothetical protein n=1 Tax=Yoonia maritima TaxID=1435347 RepID=UPI0013A65D03|nr:hypothetical protein [Yoonia maritima]